MLVIPHNSHNNVASSDVFTCVEIKLISLSLSLCHVQYMIMIMSLMSVISTFVKRRDTKYVYNIIALSRLKVSHKYVL